MLWRRVPSTSSATGDSPGASSCTRAEWTLTREAATRSCRALTEGRGRSALPEGAQSPGPRLSARP
jgi:hypothetical protein